MASSLCCQCPASRLDQVSFVPIGELRMRGYQVSILCMCDRVDKSAFTIVKGFLSPPGKRYVYIARSTRTFARIEDPSVSSNATAPEKPAACELRATSYPAKKCLYGASIVAPLAEICPETSHDSAGHGWWAIETQQTLVDGNLCDSGRLISELKGPSSKAQKS